MDTLLLRKRIKQKYINRDKLKKKKKKLRDERVLDHHDSLVIFSYY